MKPKFSTGYLTPQANRIKKNINSRYSLSESQSCEDLTAAMDINESLLETLMSCPIKRQLILKIIASEQDNVGKYDKKQEQRRKEHNGSRLSKVQRKHLCESPTALLRRRAIEQKGHQSPLLENQLNGDESRSSSQQSMLSSSASSGPSPIPFNKLLDGVIAYVEIKSKDDQDRSSGVKALMRSMGAEVRDQFTKDVTHVIFKDGSFTTYQKAKLMKVHLVSVLWIEAVRSCNTKVSEKKFPALGTEAYDHNVSSLCSQIQKDYEEIIRDELHRSLTTGIPLPSTQTLIERRRTMMTPIASTSKLFSQEFQSSQDREVEQIIHRERKTYNFDKPTITHSSPELTDDDSDLSPFINGTVTKRRKETIIPMKGTSDHVVINSVQNLDDYSLSMDLTNIDNSKSLMGSAVITDKDKKGDIYGSNMDLTILTSNLNVNESIESSTKENVASINTPNNSIYYKKTPKIKSKKSAVANNTPKRSNGYLFNVPDDSLYRRQTGKFKSVVDISSDNSTNISNEALLKNKSDNSSQSAMSSLQLSRSDGVDILSKNVCLTSTNPLPTQQEELVISLPHCKEKPHDNVEKSISTNMSSLCISSDSNKDNNISKENINNKISESSASTNMSLLMVSSDSVKDKNGKSIQENHTKTNNNFVNAENSNKLEKTTPLTRVKDIRNSNLDTSSNKSFSPLNPKVVNEVLQILDKTPLPDENVTRRRATRSVTRSITYSTRKKALSSDNTIDSDKNIDKNLEEVSPKKFKENSKFENVSVQTPQKNVIDSDGFHKNIKETHEKRKTLNKKIEPKTKLKKNNASSSDSQSASDTSGSNESNKKNKKLRKLYNPDESMQDAIESDEQEREDKRTKVRKRSSDKGVILNPNIVCVSSNIILTAKAKEFIDKNNIDIQTILNKDPEESDQEKTPIKGRKKKKKEKEISINSDADEQHQLAEEFVNRKKNSTQKKVASSDMNKAIQRKSARLSQHVKKIVNLNSSTSSNDEAIAPVTSINRRSTLEFQRLSQIRANKRLKIDKAKRPSIVCTKLHKDEIQVFNQIVKKLGGFVIEDEVSSKTTHVVAGEPKRTINMLRAIVMGCWVLKHEWLLKSLEEGKWLPEEDYEETDFSPAVQICRLQRQAFGPSYSMDIFQDCEPIYIAKGSIPRCSDLRELVSMCKGKVVTVPRNAGIIVGELIRHENVKCVKETWILDSITFNKKMPLKRYIITPGGNSPSV